MAIFTYLCVPDERDLSTGSKSGIFDLILEKISHSQKASWKFNACRKPDRRGPLKL
jgi:hypothetical protein